LLVALGAGTLLVVALAAVVALLARGRAEASADRRTPSSSSPVASSTAPVPALPAPPASPAPGDHGAGGLASTSLPVGHDGEAARLAFGGLVLERRAVGVTATYPAVSVTVAGGRALAHVQLPTANCLSPAAPADPVAAGCVSSLTEYADLPTPALRVTRAGNRLTLTGRFATYTRPNGSPPVYTGRVYDLTVTVVAGRAHRDGAAPASGTFTLGTDTARTVGGGTVNVVQRGR
jgi:hypothetical protein